MAFITVKNAKPYKRISDAMKDIFGINMPSRKASMKIYDTKWVCFFNLAEEDTKWVWKLPRKNINWLNIQSKDGSSFLQVELNKKDDSYFENVKPPPENAIFMYRKDKQGQYHYFFHGIFKRTCFDKAAGMCVYERIKIRLDTDEWQKENPIRA